MIYISSASVKSERIGDSVRSLASMGFKNIELSGGTKHYAGYMEDLVSLKDEFGLNYLVHNYFPPPEEDFVLNLTSSDEAIVSRSMGLIRNGIMAANRLKAPLYAFHPGYAVELSPVKKGIYFDYTKAKAPKQEKEALFYGRLDAIMKELPEGCRVAVENLFPFSEKEDMSLFSAPEEIFGFLERTSSDPRVGMLLDLGHLNVSSRYLGFDRDAFLDELLERFGKKIFEVHISENDGSGDVHHLTPEDSWQVRFLRANIGSLSGAPLTFEWSSTLDKTEYPERFRRIAGLLNGSKTERIQAKGR